MKQEFKKLFSAVSALAVMIAALPITELPAIAEEEMAEITNEPTNFSVVEDDSTTEEVISDSDIVVSTFDTPMIMAAQTGVTKEEWIHDLVTVFDMSIEDESTIESHFTDITDSPYAYDIDLAANYGVFDIEGESFNPDDLVTREFAAHTANYCFGYLDDSTTVTFADSDDIYYEYDAVVSVQKGWFKPSSGKFLPNAVLTEKETENILNDAKSSLESVMIDKNAEHTINYTNSVVQLDDSVNASYFNGTVTVKGTSVSVKKGNTFCVNIDGMDKLYKANNVTKDAEGNTIIAVTDASLKDAISAIDIQGYGDVDYSNAMFYGTSSSSDKVKLLQYKPNINGVQSQLVKAVNIKNDTISIDEEIDMGGASIKLSGTIKNIKPEYKLDYDGVNVNSFYLNVDADADISCTMTGNLIKGTASKEVNLAKVPVYLGGPMSADIVFSVSVSVSGEITMKYSWDINGGVSYTKAGGWRVTKDFRKKGFSIEASGSEKIAIKAALIAEVCGYKIAESYIMGGEKGTFTNTPRNNGAFFCDNLRVYAFAEFGANINLFDVVKYSQSCEFIDYNNSPLRYNKHWENGIEVAECSFDKSATSTTSKRTANKASSYSDYSTYGLEYEGIITLANSADSGDYTTYQTWTEDTKLTQSMTVNGDLYLESSIDLDGKTLTINGNLYHKSGTITVNNGTLNISGNYTMKDTTTNNIGEVVYNNCSARLEMGNQYDKVNISGNLATHNLYYTGCISLSYGTLTVGGDIWSDGHIYTNSDNGAKVVLIGTSTQSIYLLNGSMFNELEVINSEKRIINWSKDLYFNKLISDINIKANDLNLRGFDLNQHNMTINGDCEINYEGSVNLDGGSMTINGDFLQTTGTITCNNGTLNINGNYTMQKTTTNNIGEIVFNDCDARLEMDNQYDKVNISGNLTTHNLYYTGCISLSYGTLTVGGDIWSDGHIYTNSDNGAKVVLNGTSTQSIYLLNGSTFNELNVINPEKRVINWSKDLYFNKLISDINIKANDLNLRAFDLNRHNMTINGDCEINYEGSVNLDGGLMTINGDFLQTTGTITCNNGTLNINGNYTMQKATTNNIGEIVFNDCDARLEMDNQYDKVNISGNLTTHNLYYTGCISLSYGILTVGGDIWSDGHIYTNSDNGHRTILTGNKKQSVTLGSSNKFNILVLTKSKSNYTFNPENCWNTLITVEAGSGDANGDGGFTVADVVLLQKWLLAVPNTNLPCWQAVDLCKDGKLDVFDLCLLKRKLIQ